MAKKKVKEEIENQTKSDEVTSFVGFNSSCDLTVKKFSTDGHGVVFGVDIEKLGISQMNNNSLVLSYDKLPDNFDANIHDLQGELHLVIGVFDKK